MWISQHVQKQRHVDIFLDIHVGMASDQSKRTNRNEGSVSSRTLAISSFHGKNFCSALYVWLYVLVTSRFGPSDSTTQSWYDKIRCRVLRDYSCDFGTANGDSKSMERVGRVHVDVDCRLVNYSIVFF